MTEHLPAAADVRQERDPDTAALRREASTEARLQELEQTAQDHPYVAQVTEQLRVSWWPEQRYASGQPPRPAVFVYHKRTRRGGHYSIATSREEALTLLREGGE